MEGNVKYQIKRKSLLQTVQIAQMIVHPQIHPLTVQTQTATVKAAVTLRATVTVAGQNDVVAVNLKL